MARNETAGARLEGQYRNDRRSLVAWASKALGDPEVAEDLVQGVFLGALSRLDVLSAVENLGAWLFAAVKRRVIDEWRASSRRPPSSGSDVLEEIAATAGLDPAQALADAEIRDALADAIEALPPEQAFVIREQALEGSTFRELSERTGVPENTLASRKRYGIDTIARTLRVWIE